MRLYTRTGATALDHPDFGHFDADPDGGFDFPNELSDQLHGFAVNGRPLWETDVERQRRVLSEEMDRRRDPASLYEAVAQLMLAAQALPGSAPVAEVAPEPVEAAEASAAPAKKRAPSKRAVTPPAAE